MDEVAVQTMNSVSREIGTSLGDARAALESHVEQPENGALLERCIGELHQVQGALRVLEIYGAALLAEEMEQVARYLATGGSQERSNQAEALDALMRAMVQLPSYLERVLAGGRDLALVLLPLLNDLRAVRGSALLSEGTLLLLNLKSDRQAQPAAPAPGEPPLSVAQWARRLRSRFQTGLIGWIRGERLEQNQEILAAVSLRMEQVATQQCVFQLWWVVGALLESLREGGIEESVSVKRLLGLADRELKRLYELGEARYAQNPPIELLNNLLYYVARSSTAGPRVAAVRASFRLNELLPVDDTVEQERESLSAPSVKLMQTVAAAIREDLTRVKDVLDIYVRRGGSQGEELRPQLELLRKIGDTLGVLGLGELRANVQEAATRLDGLVAGSALADEAALVQIAAMLIKVEDRLDDQLVGLILPRGGVSQAGAPAGGDIAATASLPIAEDADFRQVQSAVLRECVVNLARVKESVAQNVSGSLEAAGFDSWPDLMRGIKAGLLMLGKGRAVEIVDGVSRQLKRVMQPGGAMLSGENLDRLADAIVSVEYYIETLQAGRSDPWYMLDNAQACLEVLEREPARVVPTVPPLPPGDYARTVRIPPPPEAAGIETTGRSLPVPPVLAPAAPIKALESAADPDLLRLFIEEAREELERTEQHYPVWDENPLAVDALATVRRSYHTLKGSGRMVGARAISEFAWAIENLLNHLLDGTLTRTPGILAVLRSSREMLPRLVADLEHGGATTDAQELIARAHALAAGRELAAPTDTLVTEIGPTSDILNAALASTPPALEPPPPEPAEAGVPAEADDRTEALVKATPPQAASAAAGGTRDEALRDIYARETASHVGILRGWLAHERGKSAPHPVTEEAYRACHTLTGSSRMAEVRHSVRVAEPLNRWLRKSFDSNVGVDDADLGVIADCVTALEDVALHQDESTGYFAVHDTLRARVARAEVELDRRIAETAERHAREASVPSQPPAPPAAPIAVSPAVVSSTAVRVAALPEFDPEVAGIFCEEASELLEAAQSALQAWNMAPDDATAVAALKRPVHTLKGGARMAGIEAMGDLAHELESLVSQIELGLAAGDARARRLAQQTVDELAHMREQVLGTRRVTPATALLAQIASVLYGEAVPADVDAAHGAAMPAPAAAMPSAELQQPDAAPPEQRAPPELRAAPEQRVAPVEAAPRTLTALPAIDDSQLTATLSISIADGTPRRDAPPADETPQQLAGTQAAPAILPPGREPQAGLERGEMARVSAELLDQLLNYAGEASIARARLEQQFGTVEFNLGELSRTVTRLKEQLRKLEIETEAQILHRHEGEAAHRAEFDPLELDRYSSIQQFSRALAESANDVASLQQVLEGLVAEAQDLLQQQARTVTELQNGLMRTRMVSLHRHLPRLARIVRQTALESGKQAELLAEGASGELDRQVLERMLPPFEHLLRNSVVHGIETAAERVAAGKPATGRIELELRREGSEVIVVIRDDGAGMNLNAIRDKGLRLGLITADQQLSDEDVMQLVLEPGFSTANAVTLQAGRGVGMDVVATEVKKLGGSLLMESTAGLGCRFTIRLPVTLAVSHALVVRAGEEYYALPLPTIEGVVRVPRNEVATHLGADGASFIYGNQKYRLQPLALYVGAEPAPLPETDAPIAVVLVRAGEHSTGIVADELIGSREIVVKPVGPQVAGIRGISGATILSDGRVVVILDIGALVRGGWRGRSQPLLREREDQRTLVLVVDDSITVRRVTQRLLERNGMRVMTARDGMDAVTLLAEHVPDIILLDIEMPRMDGYELAAHVRGDARLRDVPIIMITSRVGEKHRARAIELGVNDYLGKPYQESQLIDAIAPLVAQRRARLAAAQ